MKNDVKRYLLSIFIAAILVLTPVLIFTPDNVSAGNQTTTISTSTSTTAGSTNQRPIAKVSLISSTKNSAGTQKTVIVSGSSSYDPDGHIVDHYWSSTGNAQVHGSGHPSTFTCTFDYHDPDHCYIRLIVFDNEGEWNNFQKGDGSQITIYTGDLHGPPGPDFSIDKTDDPDPVWAGDILTYKITACNNDPPKDPKIIDDYDENYLTVIDADGGVDTGSTIYWDNVNIPGQDCVYYTIKFLVDECTPNGKIIKNKARILYNGNEIDSKEITTTVLNDKICGFEVDKKVSKKGCAWFDEIDAKIGDRVRFNITIKNDGDDTIYLKNITDWLPKGLKYIEDSSTIDGVSWEPVVTNYPSQTKLFWNIMGRHVAPEHIETGPITGYYVLFPGEKMFLEFTAEVEECGDLVNEVIVVGTTDENLREGFISLRDTATVHVECEPSIPDIEIIKTHDVCADCVDVGDVVTYTYTVTNIGDVPLHGIVVDDDLLGSIAINETELDPGDWAVGTKQHTVVEGDLPGPIVNVVTVRGYDSEQTEVTDQDSQTVEICEPCIEYTPHQYDFGCMQECEIDTTTFEIWNGCAGTLEYELSWDCGWIYSVSPISGESTGEHDTITVEINTAGLYFGDYSCDITISSNDPAGDVVFTVYVTVGNCGELPILEITRPSEPMLYLSDEGIMPFGLNLIIGPITLKADAIDEDGTIERIELYIGGQEKFNTTEDKFEYLWNERAFGRHTIKVKAYDNDENVVEKEISILIINFGFGV